MEQWHCCVVRSVYFGGIECFQGGMGKHVEGAGRCVGWNQPAISVNYILFFNMSERERERKRERDFAEEMKAVENRYWK